MEKQDWLILCEQTVTLDKALLDGNHQDVVEEAQKLIGMVQTMADYEAEAGGWCYELEEFLDGLYER